MSPERYADQLTRFCTAAGAQSVLLDAQYAEMLDGASLTVHTFDESLAGGPRSSCTEAGALVQFTSGSVGTPKGIYLTLDAVGANCLAIIDALAPGPGDSLCSWLPLSHDMGLIGQLLSALSAGARPIRPSQSHAHEAGDLHGQSPVVAAHVFGKGGDAHGRPELRAGPGSAHEPAPGSARPLAAAIDHRRLGVGSRGDAGAFRRRIRACRIPADRVLLRPTAWPRRRWP